MNIKIHILLPVHNRCQVTEKFVTCLKAQTYSNYHLILIDDGSTDGTAEMVLNELPGTTVIKGNGRWWWAGSLQQGFDWISEHQVSRKDVLMISNDDITFAPDFLHSALSVLEEVDSTLLLAQLQEKLSFAPRESGVEIDMKHLTFRVASSPASINCLSTRGLFMRVSDIGRIGGFYPRLLPHYLSDYEFTIRAHRKGFKLLTTPKIMIALDETQSGYRSFEKVGFFKFLQQFFSKRSVANPIYFTSFLFLACPWKYLPMNVLRVWWNALMIVMKKLKETTLPA